MRRLSFLIPIASLCSLLLGAPAAAQPENVEAWWLVEAPGVALYTDAEPERAVEIATGLARFRAVFAQLAPEIDLSSPVPTTMFAFRDGAAFAPYKSRADGGGTAVLGQFVSHRDGNLLTIDADPRRVAATAVIYHEYVHFLLRHNVPGAPLWLNEGLAEYYSTFAVDDEHALVGAPVARHLRWLARRGGFSLGEVLQMSTRDTRGHGAEEVGALYAGSWLLVHYLLSGEAERLDATADYLARVARGEDSESAFEDAFGVWPASLEETLLDYARSGELPQASIPLSRLPSFEPTVTAAAPADVLIRLADLLASMGRTEAASRHVDLALRYRPDHADAHGLLAWIRDLEGRLTEAELLYEDALRLGPADPRTFLRWGRHLLGTLDVRAVDGLAALATSSGDPEGEDGEAARADPAASVAARAERAREAFRQVVARMPSFAEGHAMLGVSFLFGGADPAEGIPSLTRAVERLPNRYDLVTDLVELHARARQTGAAEGWIDGVLEGSGQPELLAKAREAVERWTLLHASEDAFAEGDVEQGLAWLDQAVSVTSEPGLRARLATRLLALQARFESR